ncbi:hypothetical protein KCP69_25730 [Salmonella enterica subsp. enterica]|nr:hypothetical protein KCP69_25730 [Salmonella enterica subsp. enterica]
MCQTTPTPARRASDDTEEQNAFETLRHRDQAELHQGDLRNTGMIAIASRMCC